MLTRFSVTVCAPYRARAVVSFVEARAFENDVGWEKYSANMAATFRTNCQRFIGHFLPDLEAMVTSLALVFIGRHTAYHLETVALLSVKRKLLLLGMVQMNLTVPRQQKDPALSC